MDAAKGVKIMYNNEPIRYIPERRKKKDFICSFLDAAVIIVWIAILGILSLVHFALPREENFFDRLFNMEVNQTLDLSLLNIAFMLLIFLFVFSLISIILNTRRLKRRSDYLRKSFIISLAGSVVGIIVCAVLFASNA